MEWIEKNIPWLITAFVAWFVKTIIKANKSKERIDQVAEHEESIKTLQDKMGGIEEGISGVRQSLDRHIEKQDSDMTAIMTTLLEILETIKLGDQGETIRNTQKEFQKHIVKRKEENK
jgi:hypothetical protein